MSELIKVNHFIRLDFVSKRGHWNVQLPHISPITDERNWAQEDKVKQIFDLIVWNLIQSLTLNGLVTPYSEINQRAVGNGLLTAGTHYQNSADIVAFGLAMKVVFWGQSKIKSLLHKLLEWNGIFVLFYQKRNGMLSRNPKEVVRNLCWAAKLPMCCIPYRCVENPTITSQNNKTAKSTLHNTRRYEN